MPLDHNQWAVVAIVSTLCLAGAYTVVDSGISTTEVGGFEPAGNDLLFDEASTFEEGSDQDGDGISDRMEETLYGTDWRNPDTDGDDLSDGWEIANGLDPLDDGTASNEEIVGGDPDSTDNDEVEQNETFPDPNNGPDGDPDRDGLTNREEAELGTNPNLKDTDGDGMNDRWESEYTYEEITPTGTIRMFDPLDGNWGCSLLTVDVRAAVIQAVGEEEWENNLTVIGRQSCDAVLDLDEDSLNNYIEERYSTNPLEKDSDNDLISDEVEVSFGTLTLQNHCGVRQNPAITGILGPFSSNLQNENDVSWFSQDMDNDGRLNGPSDWDTDGDGMPDGFEYCFNDILNPSNASDSFPDGDDDGLSNLAEYEVAINWGPENFTDPSDPDTDNDGMPDGWEFTSGLHPKFDDSVNDPDMDGYDVDGDGAVTFSQLVGTAEVQSITVELGQFVTVNTTVAWAKIVENSQYVNVPLKAPVTGYVYSIPAQMLLDGVNDMGTEDTSDDVDVENEVKSRSYVWMTIVEESEKYTNLDEYQSKFNDEGVAVGRSTDPLIADTDYDGLIDGIEVIGWDILVVEKGVVNIRVTSDPRAIDTDDDGLTDADEYYIHSTNASNEDTDSDGLHDRVEVIDGHQMTYNGILYEYTTNASMFDTDNDGLADGEEVVAGQDFYITHANNSDTDDDGLNDGAETLFVPRPWQEQTNPKNNDTDGDGQPDGWEMQVTSTMDNKKTHSLWISTRNWLPPGCDVMAECGKGPGGWLWDNFRTGFQSGGDRNGDGEPDPKYFISEMNLSGFDVPELGRWALNPAENSAPDTLFDIDNDSLLNTQEVPDRWDTNPVNDDSDGDRLPDGWETAATEAALNEGLVDNMSLELLGARGPLDPRMPDSDLDGIMDGDEDFDNDGLNRTALMNRYCPSWNGGQGTCHIDPNTASGVGFYDDLENFTNYEEYQNGTSPVYNDSDMCNGERCPDGLLDGYEVFHKDSDGDTMWDGWEYYFSFDPMDPSDANIDSDGDGISNRCECDYNSNPKDSSSFPKQGEICDDFA